MAPEKSGAIAFVTTDTGLIRANHARQRRLRCLLNEKTVAQAHSGSSNESILRGS
jgi:hypothetical protein